MSMLMMSIIFLAIFLFWAFICYPCCHIRRSHQRLTYVHHIAASRFAAQPLLAAATAAAATPGGLDQQKIDAIPSLIIGENGEIMKEDDKTCSICLSEYDADEKLKVLPQCLHRFHSECIDRWLRFNGNCPICRVPLPHHP